MKIVTGRRTNSKDEVTKVQISVRGPKGNISRNMAVADAKVSDVFAIVEKAVKAACEK